MSIKIAVLGSGIVGETLANGLIKHGFSVVRGSRVPAKLNDWKNELGDKANIGTFQEASKYADLIFLAVKGSVDESVIKNLPATHMNESLCMLWRIPGLSRNQWGHAFKLLKV
jgi:predicted dinucleotide-binding enzyme